MILSLPVSNKLLLHISMVLGLRDEWYSVIEALKQIIPVYDKVNNVISLGKADEYRLLGVKYALKGKNMLILDAGSGYGNMSSSILSVKKDTSIVMLDPIMDMLILARERFKEYSSVVFASGVFEHLPFRDSIFDAVVCSYSFRDAINMSIAIREFYRVLKDDGRLVIVDIGKPDDAMARFGASIYLRLILPLMAFMVAGRLGLRFSKIYDTYRRLPRNSQLMLMLKECFPNVTLTSNMLGAAVVFVASKR